MTATAIAQAQSKTVDELLTEAVALDASDLHVVVGSPPTFRVQGRLRSLEPLPLSESAVERLVQAICPPDMTSGIAQTKDADFAIQRDIEGVCRRFRVNVFRARGLMGFSIRMLLDRTPTFEWAGFPGGVAARIAGFRNGLTLFTGISGSGKSTTMAMLLNLFIERGGCRILTIEDPIEYVFTPLADTIISQREVGVDVASFADGLKYGLRQDPDIILVGEIRDRPTAQMALSAAETGHLVLSTMHTRDAKGAITRLADMFPQDAQQTIRTQLAMSLRAVVSQHLVPPATEGQRRALAVEVMFNTLPVASAIRTGKIESIDDAILSGKTDGMISLDDSLKQHVQAGRITIERARRFANDPKRIG